MSRCTNRLGTWHEENLVMYIHACTACMHNILCLIVDVSGIIFVLCYRLRLLRDWMPSVLRWFLSSLRRWVYTQYIHVFSTCKWVLPFTLYFLQPPFAHLPSLFPSLILLYSFPRLPLFSSSHPQHQQQVAAAVERAKQVTTSELNAIIGVSHCRSKYCARCCGVWNAYLHLYSRYTWSVILYNHLVRFA